MLCDYNEMNLLCRRFLFFLLLLPHLNSGDLADERAALIRLRSAERGRTLLWNTTTLDPCFWKGVGCDKTINRVTALRLPGSGLSGELPPNTVGSLAALRVLSLRENSLSGRLPPDLASCTVLTGVYLQGNRFSGEIPDGFFTLNRLQRVDFSRNDFTGTIPPGFDSLTQLRTLFIENNRFAGPLTTDFHSLVRLRNFNVSFNALTGSIPSRLAAFPPQSFVGTSLCGRPLLPCSGADRDKLSGGAIAGIAAGSLVFILLILTALFFSWRKCRRREISPTNQTSPASISPVHKPPEEIITSNEIVFLGEDDEFAYSLEELMGCSAEVMGKGLVGSTYKAYTESGDQVIVKRLRNVCVSEEQFRRRVEEIGSIVHENLDVLKGYLYGTVEKLLLYQPNHNGSLSAHLHGTISTPLPWEARAKIAGGIARGIRYLHSISTKTVHGNIKSSNVFLTANLDPIVSEYGLVDLVAFFDDGGGYRAPEVLECGYISQEADVYSFGVVLLELITGKSPDKAVKEDGSELAHLVRLATRDQRDIEVIDPAINDSPENIEPFLSLAISCTAPEPHTRPSMADITRRLDEIKVSQHFGKYD